MSEERINEYISKIRFIRRDSFGRVPYGYKVSAFNPRLLEIIPQQLVALHRAVIRIMHGESTYKAAKWLCIHGGREISASALNKYYKDFEAKVYKNMADNAQTIKEELERDPIPEMKIRPRPLIGGSTKAQGSVIRKRFRDDTGADESQEQTDGFTD